ncbi:hypothetical protein GH714_029961 [Hevea brasiliensis]|uniref:Uncharacterized protein n=1 Tax=Hevea brasiliensis TaxID=3981 RepID=A0A6A6N4U7_HEVBR|nr:hypothetical protein GH714_029961 [Hevea brasiliensis]
MIESLLNPTSSQGNVSVNAIVGIGGLGKTALAQLVYNDEKVKNYFERKMWQCISEEFDVKLLVKKILECATNNEVPNLLGLEQLHIRLKENLEGKRYLLVLDDVWNEDQKKWDDLKAYLLMDAPGSKILVTTRSTRVALVMGVDSPYVLQGLADNEAWDLFDKLAFGEGHGAVMNPNLIKIGKEMVKKCKGVPLAIRSLGSLMQLKTKESEWSSILESELWRSFQTSENENALSVLKLSYCQMPTYLRQCFSYCAMFPKGHEFDKETLIRLWIAQGYIVCSSKDDDLEDIGDQYFNELLCRSFFHQSESMSHYKMHDLIHDLAQSIIKDRRDFGRDIIEVPNSIAKLKYLRYLDISGLDMETLPKSITNLQNLQTLILSYCIYLQELPRDIEKLISLRCLMIDGCGKPRCMPIGLGKLTCLRQLSDFVVAKDEGSKGPMLNELNSLNQLRGSIYLHLLTNVENVEIESNQVNLREKKHLQFLELCWRNAYLYEGPIDKTEVEKNELLLEKLEPHPNLQSLVVESFKAASTIGPTPLSKNPSSRRPSFSSVSDEEPSFLASTSFTSYPSLQEIELRNCFNLRGWWRKKKRSGVELAQFPCLSKMQIWGCYKLILDDGEVIEWGGLRSLQSLSFRFLSELKSLPKGLQFATNLQELIINYCDSLMALPDWIGNLTSLQWLEIYNCPNLRSLPEGMHLLTSLQKLRIARCRKLSTRFMKEKGVDWPKIAHIPNLEIQPPEADAGAKRWKKKGAWRGAYFPKFNVTVAYHRAVLLSKYQWQPKQSAVANDGLKGMHRVDVDIPADEWATIDDFYDVGHDKFPKESPLVFYRAGQPILPPLGLFDGLKAVLDNMVSYIQKEVPGKTLKFWRLQSPRHFYGGEWNQNGSCLFNEPLKEYELDLWFDPSKNGVNKEARQINHAIKQKLQGTDIHLLDLTHLSEYRADAHPAIWLGKKDAVAIWGQDCMHWCLPGVPDTWVDILSELIRQGVSRN